MFTHLAKSNYSRGSGFTLVETLVALVLLSMAIIPALVLSTKAVNISANIEDTFIASNLAQEGVEVIRAIRDTNWFNSRPFDTGLVAGSYRVEWDSEALLPLGGNPPLNLIDGHYTYVGGTATKFTRSIIITKPNAAELKVISQVDWVDKGTPKTVQTEEHLFDWR